MSISIPDILFRPDTFYENAAKENGGLKNPALIILAGAIVGALVAFLITGPAAQMSDGITPGLGSITIVLSLVGGFIGVFFMWTYLAALFLIISMILRKEVVAGLNREFIAIVLALGGLVLAILPSVAPKSVTTSAGLLAIVLSLLSLLGILAMIVAVFLFLSNDKYQRPLEFVGYGYLPQVFGSLVTLVLALEYLPRVTVPKLTQAAMNDPAAITSATNALMHDPVMVQFTQMSGLVAIVFMLWSAHIWIYGMQHARGLSMRDAAICVGLPIVLYVIFSIYTIGAL